MEPVIGLDFGTTNSSIAVADEDRQAALAAFADGPATTTSFRSILYFPARDKSSPQKVETQAGPEAINSYLDADTKGRLIVSIKSYLASPLFTSTSINGRNYTLEDLIAIILRRLRTGAMEQFGTAATQVVLGRPVRFSGAENEADEKLALQRLTAAAERAGFKQISFELEPVAAAYQYETQLDHDELVLIGDFGGGTSDFTLARLGPGRKKAGRSPVLGTSGVAIAGDTFDSRIMMRLVAPKLGLGSHYISLGKELPVPVWVYSQLSSWHHMFLLKEPKTMAVLREVRNQATEPQKVAALVQIIAENLGYALYRAVEQTKVQLTEKELAGFLFSQSIVRLEDSLERWQFESWIQDDIQNIAACIRSLLDQCGVKPADIDSIFLTGGSSFVPVVRRFFSRTFGANKLRSGEELTTVAKGLALRALEAN
ncbi:MAG TPA: Hsp70 family protein [Pyrinomonadaceae bacterium]|nr:Hsp70 family protein [Pyrinomonadaceae bacterium]